MNKKPRSDKLGAFYVWMNFDDNFLFENTRVLNEAGIPEKRWLYVSKSSPTAIVILKESEKAFLLSDSNVTELTPYTFNIPEKMSDEITLSQIGAGLKGTNSPELMLRGNGINVGIITAENLIYDDKAKGLDGKEITVLPSIIPPKIDRHPTCVVSEIISSEVTSEKQIFFGVVRNAKAFFAPTYSEKNVYDSIETMTVSGVKVINYSAGSMHDGVRKDFDRQIDRLITNSDFLFAVAAGNYTKMASPAKAYNALSVGNAVTKTSALSWNEPPFEIGETSAYSTDNTLPHKPEIVAPGEWIGYVTRDGEADFQNFGTSFATPFVSGVAIQLLEARKESTYLTLKGVLLMGADGEAVTKNDNEYVSENSFMRKKSGYGLVDATRSAEIINKAEIIEGVLKNKTKKRVDNKEIFFIFELLEDMKYPRLIIDGDIKEFYPQTSILLKGVTGEIEIEGEGDGRFSLIIL